MARGPGGSFNDQSQFSNTAIGEMANQGEYSSATQVLYGTNINTNTIQTSLKEFLMTFRKPRDEDSMVDEEYDEDAEPYYIAKLRQVSETQEFFLEVDCNHLAEFNIKVYRQLVDYPTDVIPIFDLVALQVYKEYVLSSLNNNFAEPDSDNIIQVRPFNMTQTF